MSPSAVIGCCLRSLAVSVAVLLLTSASARAQTVTPQPPVTSKPPVTSETADEESQREATTPPEYYETITVSTTLNPATVKEAPGTVSVIDSDTIERRLMQNSADLVKFEPGVYVEANVTRIGLNGFNIRGVGGNRVMTQIDGIETTEQFDFGPFNVHQFTLDLDTLKSVEIMRSSGSALYGSDALGGVVSFFTRDPGDYLQGREFTAAGKVTYDSRWRDTSGNMVVAGGSARVLGSLFVSYSGGHQPRNQGTVDTPDTARTSLNPQNRHGAQALGKLQMPISDGNLLRAAFEMADTRVKTEAYSLRTAPVLDIDSDDTMRRGRFSIDQSFVNRLGLTQWSWSAYVQQSDTDQVVDEVRGASGPTPAVNRRGTLAYTQDSYGGTLQGRKAITFGERSVLFTFGGAHKHHAFDMIRDRLDLNATTGATVPPTGGLILPSKYFPKSEVGESGLYLQGELRLGRVLLVPGVRYDRFTLDADQTDPVFLATLSPAPADFSDSAVSSKLGASVRLSDLLTAHAQFAEGFRAPPYSAINSGFTNLLAGYTSIPNTELRSETSRNIEAGVRAGRGRVSAGVTGFLNDYDGFIDQIARGMNPTTRLLEYQYQNLSDVTIRGLELQGDVRLTNTLRARASYAAIRGTSHTGSTDTPLNSIAPNQGAVGLSYGARSNRWGSDLTVRASRAQSQATAGTGNFAPDAFAVADLTGWLTLAHDLTIRAGVLNLTDAKYFEWSNVRGRLAADTTIDRYSSPGTSGLLSVSYGW